LLVDGHIDTGSPGTLSVPIGLVDQLPLTGPVRQIGKARTVDAEFEIRAAPIDTTVRIGDAEIPLTEVHLAELPGANLGTGGLRGLSLHVDWENERFALTGTADPVAMRPRAQAVAAGTGPRFGILASPCTRCAIEVLGTEPGSPAEEIGLLRGDRILAINDKPTDKLEFAQVRAELTAAELELEIERDGRRILLKRAD
jgi:hypothetical protein